MPLDDADKKFITELLDTKLKAHDDEADKKYASNEEVQKILKQGLDELDIAGALKGALDTELKDIREQLKKGGSKGDGDGDKKNKGGTDEESPEVLKLKERQEELERKLREQEEARVAAEDREKANRLNGAINDALAAAQVPAERHAQARAFLQTLTTDKGEPVIALDDAGRAVWREQKKGYIDTLDLSAGVKGWTDTDAGKLYLPPTGNRGTGEGSGETPPHRNQGNAPRNDKGQVDWDALGQNLSAGGLTGLGG